MHVSDEFAYFKQKLGLAVTHIIDYSVWKDQLAACLIHTIFGGSWDCGLP